MSAGAAPTCLACNHSLTGVAAPRCPECGRAFNPADPTTFGPREPRHIRIARRCANAQPSLRFCVLLGISLLVFTILAAPMWHSNMLLYVVLWIALYSCWFPGLVTCSLARIFLRIRGIRCGFPTWRWLLCLVLILSAVVAAVTNQPLRIAASLSHASLTKHAAAFQQPNTSPPRFIGLFHVSRASHDAPSGITTIEVRPIFAIAPPPMAFRKGDADTEFGNMHLNLADGWRLEWEKDVPLTAPPWRAPQQTKNPATSATQSR
jgi:hypothetical protein